MKVVNYSEVDHRHLLKDIRKWMKMAKAVTEVENPCLSRQIGVVIVDPATDCLISTGHNGPPGDCPGNDNPGYLQNVVWNKLTLQERNKAMGDMAEYVAEKYPPPNQPQVYSGIFAERYGNCGICPRKIIGAASGERLELCNCLHGETSAIVNARCSVTGCNMYCWCAVPCVECTKLIIQSKIANVFCLDNGLEDYSPYSSRWMFKNNMATDLYLLKKSLIEG